MIVMPSQPPEKRAVMTTTPGVRKSTYESPVKPGSSTTRSKSAPNSTSQITG
jgi:hypothetical protein